MRPRSSRASPAAWFVVAIAFGATASMSGFQSPRVSKDAQTIRAFKLTDEHLAKLRQVSQTMARNYRPAPEAPRADAAVFAVLAMSLAYNEPYSDRTVAETAQTIESGHADLASAIRAVGLTPTDYVLTQITLLLAYPVVAQERAGRLKAMPADVAVENVTLVRRRWTDIEPMMQDLIAAGRPPQ